MSDRIEKTIELNAPVARVWQAISDYREFGEWFRVKIDAPFVAGEEATGKILYPGYEHLRWIVTVKRIEEPTLFSFTWLPYAVDLDRDYSAEIPTLVEFRLEPISKGTRLTITESGFDKVPEYRRAEAFRMNDGGWAEQIKNVKAHVER